jgi:predicted amidohydrolase YtcJ
MYDAIYREATATADATASTSSTTAAAAATVFRADQCLTFGEALWLYTLGAAFANGTEHSSGSIVPGKFADFTIVDACVLDNPRLLKDPSRLVCTHLILLLKVYGLVLCWQYG